LWEGTDTASADPLVPARKAWTGYRGGRSLIPLAEFGKLSWNGTSSNGRVVVRIALLIALAAAWVGGASLAAQESTRHETFDVSRAMLHDSTVYQPFRVTETRPLREALSDGTLRHDTQVAILERNGWRLAFVMAQLVYHHAAPGQRNGEPWLVSF
jgi:hypothetical protein